ncbi:DUF3189 family protein [Fictibacillus sp. Mic-4]|uniref:DUF3189 family protein n=1 Tax=Fictibacillus TaxID=1329200 RepID=UPI000405160F|nr:DUF3189 family protein [Fictibacillus gelatini]
MIYIYNCYGGTHSSVLAAAYHLNKLPIHRVPTKEEILSLDRFNQLTYSDMGKVLFHGEDEEGNEVYTVGRGSSNVVIPAMRNIDLLLQERYEIDERTVFSNTSPTVPIAMTFGGFFSRALKVDTIGVPLLVKGAKQSHRNIIRLVEHTKKMAKSTRAKVLVLDNKEFH